MEQTNVLCVQKVGAASGLTRSQKWRSIFAEGRRIAAQSAFTEKDVIAEIKNHRSQK